MTDDTDRAQWYLNPQARGFATKPAPGEVSNFHQRLRGYEPTALLEVPELAAELDVGRVFVKEEARRFGLPAFKMLGASWAIYRALAARTGEPDREWTWTDLTERFGGPGGVTLICATDGNHGRAVAHTAALLGLAAQVFVPGAVGSRAKEAIISEGAELVEIGAAYDDVVGKAFTAAGTDPNALMVQDTAWEGYEQTPTWIVEGYSTIFREVDSQLGEVDIWGPDVVVTPCGVGSLIQATAAHYRGSDRPIGAVRPSLLSVEPVDAACLLESLKAQRRISLDTGRTHMAGLNCGTVSTIAWPVLHGGIDAAVAVSEDEDLQAVYRLQELDVDSGPCGAASLAGLRTALADPAVRAGMGVTIHAVVVLLSTESRDANPVE